MDYAALNGATRVAGMMLHYATIEKFVAALQGALPKVELICTSCNDCSRNKNIAKNVCGRVCYTAIFRATCVATELRDKLQEKLSSIKY